MAPGTEVVVFVVNSERFKLYHHGAAAADPRGTLLGFLRSRTRFTSAKPHHCAAIGVGHPAASPPPPTSSSPLCQSGGDGGCPP
uniref:Uncharacterized protein n=1 Tax=Oryza nivara TaxID=4536 RepID=A0A0E0GI67_ORYNI